MHGRTRTCTHVHEWDCIARVITVHTPSPHQMSAPTLAPVPMGAYASDLECAHPYFAPDRYIAIHMYIETGHGFVVIIFFYRIGVYFPASGFFPFGTGSWTPALQAIRQSPISRRSPAFPSQPLAVLRVQSPPSRGRSAAHIAHIVHMRPGAAALVLCGIDGGCGITGQRTPHFHY